MFIVGSSIVQDILYEGLAEEKVVALLVLGCFGGSVGGLRRATHYLVDDALFSILLCADSADIDADDEVVVIVVVRIICKYLAEVLSLDVFLHSVLHF